MRHKTRVSALERRAKPGAISYVILAPGEEPPAGTDTRYVIQLVWSDEDEDNAAPGALGAGSGAPPAGAE